MLLSTHELDLAMQTADRLALLTVAGALHLGTPEDLVLDGTFAAAKTQLYESLRQVATPPEYRAVANSLSAIPNSLSAMADSLSAIPNSLSAMASSLSATADSLLAMTNNVSAMANSLSAVADKRSGFA